MRILFSHYLYRNFLFNIYCIKSSSSVWMQTHSICGCELMKHIQCENVIQLNITRHYRPDSYPIKRCIDVFSFSALHGLRKKSQFTFSAMFYKNETLNLLCSCMDFFLMNNLDELRCKSEGLCIPPPFYHFDWLSIVWDLDPPHSLEAFTEQQKDVKVKENEREKRTWTKTQSLNESQ